MTANQETIATNMVSVVNHQYIVKYFIGKSMCVCVCVCVCAHACACVRVRVRACACVSACLAALVLLCNINIINGADQLVIFSSY